MLISRPTKRTPANISVSWARLERWLKAHFPPQLHGLFPGTSEERLRAVERTIGQKLPDDVRESLRIHDGQGLPDQGVIYRCWLCKSGEIQSSWRCWAEDILPDQESSPEDWYLDQYTSWPQNAIECLYATRGWIPLHDWDGDHFGIDLNPGPRGIVGQVINFGRHASEKYVLAPSWAHFLEDVADELEAGNFVLEFNDQGQIENFCPADPVCAHDHFPNGFAEWSASKLPNDFGLATVIEEITETPAPPKE
jgi:cell wall assembly regulator SMI1